LALPVEGLRSKTKGVPRNTGRLHASHFKESRLQVKVLKREKKGTLVKTTYREVWPQEGKHMPGNGNTTRRKVG